MNQEPFSIRNAIRPGIDTLAYDSVPEDARKWLITIIPPNWYFWGCNRLRLIQGQAPPQSDPSLTTVQTNLTLGLLGAQWYEIYDLCEYFYTAFPISAHEGMTKGYFEHALNDILVNLKLGRRMQNGKIERVLHPSTSKALSAASDLLITDSRFSGPMEQMKKSVAHLSDRPEPDTRNCANEAVCAVEGTARILSGKPKQLLSDLLKQSPLNQMPPTLREVLNKLYGYRGDETAHGQVDTATPSLEEAEFVLATSASAIVYLVKRFPVP
ncbi:MAG: hypothetical protein ABID84_04560 [Chloroflexota bacterium]